MAFVGVIKLQSPSYDNDGLGEEIALPAVADTHQITGLGDIIPLPRGAESDELGAIMDFGLQRQSVTVVSVLTDGVASGSKFSATATPLLTESSDTILTEAGPTILAEGVTGASAYTAVANAVHLRDLIERVRTAWPFEEGGGANWGNSTLPAAEQDVGTTRAKGKVRLIFDKQWDAVDEALVNKFLYGSVFNIQFGPRAAASGRHRIPCVIMFTPGKVNV